MGYESLFQHFYLPQPLLFISPNREYYNMPTLEWIGKSKVINHHQDVPFRVLKEKYTYNNSASENKIIHGDNLEALKSLLPEYEGRIDCIYIDPPYNTGNEGWVYNDNVNDPKIKKWLGEVVGKEGEDLSRHDKWLCMMYPRLRLLHQLLSEDGVIFISIDDNEQANLKLLCDEIFGAQNFINNVIWQKKFSPQNDAKYFSDMHDFVLIYTKNKEKWNRNLLPRKAEQNTRYKNPDNDPRGVWTSGDLSVKTYSSAYDYPITTPSGRVVNPPAGYSWRVSNEKYLEMLQENRIWFGSKGENVPRIKRFLSDVQGGLVPVTLWLRDDVGDNQEAKQTLKKIFPDSSLPFNTPKPPRLIERILEIASDNNSIILDSFAGSGTTAHAVLNMNKKDGGNRKFILIEMEDYADSITAERVKRVIDGYKDIEGTGGDFTYYELGEPLLKADRTLNEEVPAETIRQYIWHTETRTPYAKPENENPAYLGEYNHTAYYFCYKKEELTSLDYDLLAGVTVKADSYVIYADICILSPEELAAYNITFKKIPRDITKI